MFGLLVILLCIGLYYHCKQNGCYFDKSSDPHSDALDILRARYARGEIDSDEFNERKKALE